MDYLSVEPQEICFNLQDAEPSCVVTLANTKKTKLAFKVKTTMPKRYLVKPNQDVIEPDQKVQVRISLQPKDATQILEALREDEDIQNDLKDKFMIQSAIVDKALSEDIHQAQLENDSAPMSSILAPLWTNLSQTQLQSRKFKVKFNVPKSVGVGDKDDIEELRRNYTNLITNNLKLTTERDMLKKSYSEVTMELEKLREEAQGGMKREGKSITKGFNLFQLVAVAILGFIAALLFGAK